MISTRMSAKQLYFTPISHDNEAFLQQESTVCEGVYSEALETIGLIKFPRRLHGICAIKIVRSRHDGSSTTGQLLPNISVILLLI